MRGLEACASGLVSLTFVNSSYTNSIFHDGRYVLKNLIFE